MSFRDRLTALFVDILVAVHDIILKELQIRQVILCLMAFLVIIEHGSRMDIQTVEHLCHDLISRVVAVLLFQADIIPDHIIRIVQVLAL